MLKQLFTTAIILAASSANANCSNPPMDEAQPEASLSDSSVSQTATVDNDMVKCWGWDGSEHGQMKSMSRSECLDTHGIVQNQDIRASDEPAAKAVKKPIKKHKKLKANPST